MESNARRIQKLCFVTVGATTGFDALILASLSLDFLAVLQQHRYTNLRLQYGLQGKPLLDRFLAEHKSADGKINGIVIDGFDVDKRGLLPQFDEVKGRADDLPGIVISHAGD